ELACSSMRSRFMQSAKNRIIVLEAENMIRKLTLSIALLAVTMGLARWTAAASSEIYKFDAEIVNNSLAVSPDERLAVACYSAEPAVHVYDLKTGRPLTTLPGFITPRNILFTPDGSQFLISDSTRGVVAIVDAGTFKEVGSIPIGVGAFGT